MDSIGAEPRRIGKENLHVIFVTSQWSCSWRNLAYEGLSRRTVGEGAGVSGAEVARGAVAAAA